ncbi:programmed cell death protein 1 [Mixophyes fleayi]|uniref:programmed cell death protein 1 n=1 Tax=Mixophyes fleayi TaxID=3061075 RepID=UPI003F4D9E45
MSMEHFCLIICSICVSAALSLVPSGGAVLFTHFPLKLHLKVGETATFTCNFTGLKHNPEDINWHRKENDQQVKIADLKSGQNGRLSVTMFWDLRKAELSIRNVTLNDSGKYYCGYLNITVTRTIIVSNVSELIVESYQSTATEVIDLIDQRVSPGNGTSLKMTIISTSILLTLLLLLLIGIAIILVWHKQRNKPSQPQVRNQDKPPQDPAVYTVDYGVLEFGSSQPYRKSAELCVLEQVEYATIMFPQEKPSMGDCEKRTA